MIIFAVDSSSCAGSAAVYKDGTILAESFANVGLTHSETLMVLCDEVFRRSGIGPCDVDYFAVTSGPGSFTGLRIGMGTVKGMAFATRKPCVAVPTPEALACGLAPCDRLIVTA
ncbi:MAG: tRNA (adenosine(37)-N6)-threonylcarbamoyltransferase complex dimerization subunit type 1 TsaB, partial [Oscillospiraceae bacterium]